MRSCIAVKTFGKALVGATPLTEPSDDAREPFPLFAIAAIVVPY